MKPTIKQLQATIKAKDRLLEDYRVWIKVLGEAINRGRKRENRLRARIKVLGKALIESERDYESLKRRRK
jgi:hypothetical protein